MSAYISTKEASEELGMNRLFIIAEIKRGNLPALKMTPRLYKIKKEDWEAYKESKKTNQQGE